MTMTRWRHIAPALALAVLSETSIPKRSLQLMPVEHPYFAITGANGAFSIDQIPPGSYTVDAWHEQMGSLPHSIEIASGDTRQIRFEFHLQSSSTTLDQ